MIEQQQQQQLQKKNQNKTQKYLDFVVVVAFRIRIYLCMYTKFHVMFKFVCSPLRFFLHTNATVPLDFLNLLSGFYLNSTLCRPRVFH